MQIVQIQGSTTSESTLQKVNLTHRIEKKTSHHSFSPGLARAVRFPPKCGVHFLQSLIYNIRLWYARMISISHGAQKQPERLQRGPNCIQLILREEFAHNSILSLCEIPQHVSTPNFQKLISILIFNFKFQHQMSSSNSSKYLNFKFQLKFSVL